MRRTSVRTGLGAIALAVLTAGHAAAQYTALGTDDPIHDRSVASATALMQDDTTPGVQPAAGSLQYTVVPPGAMAAPAGPPPLQVNGLVVPAGY